MGAWDGLRRGVILDSIQPRDRPAKQVRGITQVEPIFFEQGLDSVKCSVCYVRQFGKPKEPRLRPTAYRRVHLRLAARPRGSVFLVQGLGIKV